jgi:hypothetical protein
MVECEAIKTITCRYAKHIAVYNLKTRDGIYFANGFLVHNCGTPVIGLNAAATTNLLECGILVPAYSESLTPNMLTKAEPHPIHVMQALESVYQRPRSEFAGGIKFIQDNFAWPLIFDKWRKFFAELDVELDNRCMKSKKYPPHPSERALEMARQEVDVQ